MERAARRTGPLSDNNLSAVAAWRVQRRQYFTLLQKKRSNFWVKRMDAEKLRRVDFGGSSMSCLVAAEHCCLQTLMLLHCIASSTTRTLAFVHPLSALIHRPSRPFLSAVNSDCSYRFHQRAVHERPASYMATEAVRRRLGSFPVSTVQLVLTEQHCSVDVQVRLHYAVTEESRSGSGRRQVVSTDFQLVRHLEAAETTG